VGIDRSLDKNFLRNMLIQLKFKMKPRFATLFPVGLLVLLILADIKCSLAGELSVYPPLPDNQYRSDIFEVTVSQAGESRSSYVYKSVRNVDNTQVKSPVFTTDANHWTSFSFSGAVTVQVKIRDGTAINSAVIRPLAKNIRAEVRNNTVSFTLTNPANMFVELDAKHRDALFIFANPAETDIPARTTPNTIYFGPGVTDLGKEPISISEGQTVYLAGGAYVKGRLQIAGQGGGKTVTIRGRGVLSGIDIPGTKGLFSQFMIGAAKKTALDLNVEGIVITDSHGISLLAPKRLTAENVKILAWLGQTDGIAGGKQSLVKDCFLKVNDDCLHFHQTGIKLLNNVIWRQNSGSALQMGWNVTQDVDGELCDGLDIIGDDMGRTHLARDWANADVVALIDIHQHASYKNIVIQNVRHEKKAYQLFGVRTMLVPEDKFHDSYRDGRGSVEGMTIRNITAAELPLHPSVFDGNGREPGSIANVTFENLQVGSNSVTTANATNYVVQRGKTSGFRFISPADSASSK